MGVTGHDIALPGHKWPPKEHLSSGYLKLTRVFAVMIELTSGLIFKPRNIFERVYMPFNIGVRRSPYAEGMTIEVTSASHGFWDRKIGVPIIDSQRGEHFWHNRNHAFIRGC